MWQFVTCAARECATPARHTQPTYRHAIYTQPQEVDSVELPYLNRARLAYTASAFVGSGVVPGVQEANKREPLLPWGRYHQVCVCVTDITNV